MPEVFSRRDNILNIDGVKMSALTLEAVGRRHQGSTITERARRADHLPGQQTEPAAQA